MELVRLVEFSTPFLVLGMLLFLERIRVTVEAIREDVAELKEGVTWNDTCSARHEEINRRLDRLEASVDA